MTAQSVLRYRFTMPVGKHVIFLGAGASHGSGYPLAQDLRLLLSSKSHWTKALLKYTHTTDLEAQAVKMGHGMWDRFKDALNFFRNGGFATVDEFCKLAGPNFQSEINGLRWLVRGVLGMHNPEDHFEESEYYGFVQALFKNDLISLRDDITVLTYNYDPYLDYLLFRALAQRRAVADRESGHSATPEGLAKDKEHQLRLNAVTSGFYNPTDQSWLQNGNNAQGFCLLKLHGSIIRDLGKEAGQFFVAGAPERAQFLSNDLSIPPVFFPWEMANGLGSTRKEPLFSGIWAKAQEAVLHATKISFVGLSMHAFLEDGLKYLFQDKFGPVEILVANPDVKEFIGQTGHDHWAAHPHCSAYVLKETLQKVAASVHITGVRKGNSSLSRGEITLVPDFKTFIRTQMKPVNTDWTANL